nr:hypothetical protein [Haladaptatus sp. W1]
MDEKKQATFGSDGELRTDDEATNETGDGKGATTNDFGDECGENETKSGVNRYTVSSLLQKAVRRSDEATSSPRSMRSVTALVS